MGSSLNFKINQLNEKTLKFINLEIFEDIMASTYFEEFEVFLLIERFVKLEPDESYYSISINQLKLLDEFKNNPYRDPILHAINIYDKIYEYLKHRKNYPNREYFIVGNGITDRYHEKVKNVEDGQYLDNDQKYSPILFIEDDEILANSEPVIDFKFFCLIINEFNTKVTFNKKFLMSFNIFDLNKDGKICYRDLRNYFEIVYKDYPLEGKLKIIDNLVLNVLNEFKEGDKDYLIDFNNFQKILWSTNFITNLTIDP